MIYGDCEEQFVWGIVFPRDTLTSISSTEVPEPKTTIQLRSGITLVFLKNDVTISGSGKTIKMAIKPKTIYALHDDLSVTKSEDLSGIKLVPNRVRSKYTGDFVTTHDLVLPPKLSKRFGKDDF